MKGNRKNFNEKSYASIKDYTIPTESPEAIVLKHKATFFLAVIHSITKAFGPILEDFNAERYHAFSLQMTLYTKRCQDLQNGSSTITQLWNGAPERARQNNAAENEELDNTIKNFYYPIYTFFDGCNASIQEKILDALEAEIYKGVDEHGSKERLLQEILKKLRFHRKMSELDNTYIPTADEILNTFVLGAMIPHIDGSFPLITKPVSKARGNNVKALFFPDEQSGLKKPQEQVNQKTIEIQEITAALSDEDIYNKIDKSIKPNLFSGKVCQHSRVQKQFSEIFEMEKGFLNFLESIIKEELPYIRENITLKRDHRQFIEDFLRKLTTCLGAQKELYNRMEKCRSNFHLDEPEKINDNAIRIFLGIYEEHNLKKQTDSFLQLIDDWFKIDELLAEHKDALTKLVTKRETETIKDFEKYQQEIANGLQEHSEENDRLLKIRMEKDKQDFEKYRQEIAKELQEHSEKNDRLLIVRLREDEQERILPTIAYAQRYALSSRVAQICTRRIMISTEVLESLKLDDLSSVELDNVRAQYKLLCYLCSQYNLVMNIKQDGYICLEDLTVLLETHFDAKERYSLAYFLIHPKEKQALKELKKLNEFKEAFLSFARRFDGNESRIQFFKEIFELFQKKPLRLHDLNFLRTYVAGNPLRLSNETLAAIKEALESNEPNSVINVKNIIISLIPMIADVNRQLNKTLKEFQLSPEAIDVLLTVPDIKEKVGDKNSLAALDKEAIANLPSFWRDIFVSEEGALRKSLTQKKGQWHLYHNRIGVPESIRETLEPLLDNERSVDYEEFISKKKCIAQDLFEIEIEKQIKLLGGEEGIFSDAVLAMLTAHIQDKMPGLLQKLPQSNEQFFLFYYAEAILQIRYILIQILQEYLSAEKKRIGKAGGAIANRDIFSSHFRPNTKDTALDLKSLIALLKEVQRNRPRFDKSEKTTSAFRVFALVKEKSKPDVYQQLKAEISVLSSQPGTLSKKARDIEGPTPGGKRVLPNGIPPEDSGSATPLPTPVIANSQNEKLRSNIASPYSTPRRVVKATGRIDFKALVGELDKVVKTERLELTKYIQSGVNRKECSTKGEKENCNYLEARKSDESKKLLFTAQSSDKGSSVTVHCHEKHLVAKTVAAMANSIRAATPTLEIDINASAAEIPKLINQYVGQALKKNIFPKVIVNGNILEPAELCKELDKSLALKYKKVSDAQKQVRLSENKLVFLAPAGACSQKTTARRTLKL